MTKNSHYILIDYENVQVKSLALLKDAHFQVRVFLGPKNSKLATEFVLAMKALGERGDFIVLDAGGANALDFHIAYYLGKLAELDSSAAFYVISKDKGFDPLIAHLNKNGIACERAVAIDDMSCFGHLPKPAQTHTANKSVSKAPAAKKTVTKSEKKPATKMKADELVIKVVENLKKRSAGLPRSEKTLRSVIGNVCGSVYSEKEIEAVFNRLVKTGVVDNSRVRLEYTFANS
ncbi:MAG: hypothetical protein KDI30_05720 [Pseudomonadales bacterium]|nr:hypothetical protein [Pseudomonadales bacterium]